MFIFPMCYKSLGMIQERQIFLCKTMQHLSTTVAPRERNIFPYPSHYNHKRIIQKFLKIVDRVKDTKIKKYFTLLKEIIL